MNPYTRLLICWLACGAASVAWASPPQQPDSAQRQAQQKGRLWTVAVQQGWPALAAPQWPTKDSLESWLTKQPQRVQEVKRFQQNVVDYISQTYGRRRASTKELAQALATQLPKFLKARRSLTDTQQQVLSRQLQAALNALERPDVPEDTLDERTVKSISAASKGSMENRPAKAESEPAFPYWLWLAGGIGVALGFVAGLLLGRRKKTFEKPSSSIAELRAKQEKEKFKQDSIDAVQHRSNRSKFSPNSGTQTSRQREGRSPTPTPASDVPGSAAADENEVAPAGSEVTLVVPLSQPPAPVAATCLYGPAPDTATIEARKFSPQSLPQMPICLTLATTEATAGSFSLNPHAEQSRLIGNGIRELRTFFDFDSPLPESFTTLTTSRPGKLELRNGSWHLVDKAKIELA